MYKIPKHYLKQVYYALFESVIRYGLLLYGNSSDLPNILLLQKKAVRIITMSPPRLSCRSLFKTEKIMTVYNLYIFELLMYVNKNITNYTSIVDLHRYETRNNDQLNVPHVRLQKTQSSYVITALKVYNKIPTNIKALNETQFKFQIKRWLQNNPFYNMNEFFENDVVF